MIEMVSGLSSSAGVVSVSAPIGDNLFVEDLSDPGLKSTGVASVLGFPLSGDVSVICPSVPRVKSSDPVLQMVSGDPILVPDAMAEPWVPGEKWRSRSGKMGVFFSKMSALGDEEVFFQVSVPGYSGRTAMWRLPVLEMSNPWIKVQFPRAKRIQHHKQEPVLEGWRLVYGISLELFEGCVAKE